LRRLASLSRVMLSRSATRSPMDTSSSCMILGPYFSLSLTQAGESVQLNPLTRRATLLRSVEMSVRSCRQYSRGRGGSQQGCSEGRSMRMCAVSREIVESKTISQRDWTAMDGVISRFYGNMEKGWKWQYGI
jgi:hypothetical protein